MKKTLKITLPLLLGVLLVWYSLSRISIPTLIQYFKDANYWWIAFGLFFGVLSHLSRAYRWKFMLEPLGYTPKFANSVMAVLIAYLVNYTVPRAGEISRAAILTNYEGVPFEKGFGTIVAERIADLIMMLFIILITLFVQFDFIIDLLTMIEVMIGRVYETLRLIPIPKLRYRNYCTVYCPSYFYFLLTIGVLYFNIIFFE